VDQQTIDKLLLLSQLSLLPEDREKLLGDLSSIIELIDFMQSIDTDGVKPLSHPLEVTQRLRADEPETSLDQEQYQAIAPQVRDGLYLVPRVVE
jgi:aspartyl-tRNA(Asn)/glutamyl-tRNA(Gln) amidotransferase subunit C